jgi:hypothetical protein
LEGGTSSFHSVTKPVNNPYGRVATLIIVKSPTVDFSTFLSPEDFFITSIRAEHLRRQRDRFHLRGSFELGKNPGQKPSRVIPIEASRRLFFSFAPANESAGEVEESLFDRSRKPSSPVPLTGHPENLSRSNISNTPRQRSF